MDCRECNKLIDSFLSDELLVETNNEVLSHLETCADCSRKLSQRQALIARVRQTVRNAEEFRIDPNFAAKITNDLRTMALEPRLWDRLIDGIRAYDIRMVSVGFACVLLLIMGGVAFLYRSNKPPQTAGIDIPANGISISDAANAIRNSWNEIASHAVGDHENCAIKYNLKEAPISLEEAAKTYGAYNKDIDKAITNSLNKDEKNIGIIEFLESHSCVFEGRRFAHIVYKTKGRVVSFLVTDTDVPAANGEIQLSKMGEVMNSAGFRIGHNAIFVVSDLNADDNASLATAAVPAIRSHFEKHGA